VTTITIPWEALVSDNRRHARRGGRAHGWDYKKARDTIRTLMAAQMRGDPFGVPVSVRYDFHPPDLRRRDATNFLKVVGDSGNTVLWVDDCLITQLSFLVHQPDGSEPRLEITVQARRAA